MPAMDLETVLDAHRKARYLAHVVGGVDVNGVDWDREARDLWAIANRTADTMPDVGIEGVGFSSGVFVDLTLRRRFR